MIPAPGASDDDAADLSDEQKDGSSAEVFGV
jgi:hypothetical protein